MMHHATYIQRENGVIEMKTDSYFTPGNPKRKRTYDPQWFKRISLKAYTDVEWTARFKEMSVKEQFDFIKVFVPKEVKVESDTTISLIINGVRQAQAIDGHQAKALIEHDNDDA